MRLRHTNTRRKEERCLVRPNNRDPVCSSDIKGSIVKVNIRCGEGKRSTTFAGDESVQRILHRLCCWFWRPPRHDRQYWYHKQGVDNHIFIEFNFRRQLGRHFELACFATMEVHGTVIFVLSVTLWTVWVVDGLMLGKGELRLVLPDTASNMQVALIMAVYAVVYHTLLAMMLCKCEAMDERVWRTRLPDSCDRVRKVFPLPFV